MLDRNPLALFCLCQIRGLTQLDWLVQSEVFQTYFRIHNDLGCILESGAGIPPEELCLYAPLDSIILECSAPQCKDYR